MGITLSGSLDITGSLFVNGTAVSTGSGGGGSFNAITELYNNLNNLTANTVQTLDVNAGGVFNMHISESGLHKIDAFSIGAPSASVNIYFYPDLFTTSGSQAAVYATLNSGSGNGVVFRTLVSSSTSTYYATGTAIGTGNSQIARNSTKTLLQYANGATGNPVILSILEDGTKIFGALQNPIGSLNYSSTGDQGTPIV